MDFVALIEDLAEGDIALWLTPSQVRLSVLKRLFPVIMLPGARIPLVRIGTDYGGWWVPRHGLKERSVCYLAGVGTDVSFDLGVIEEFGADVWAFDPTPRSAEWLARQSLPDKFHFQAVGLAGSDQNLRLYEPANPAHVSYSVANLQATTKYVDVPALSLSTIAQSNLHDEIVLLKMDIEGSQHGVINSFGRDQIFPKIVCVEMDQPEPLRQSMQSVRKLKGYGYVLVKTESFNMTFVQRAFLSECLGEDS